MNDHVQTIDYGYVASAEQRNKVLRNTYWLLALSLIPTTAVLIDGVNWAVVGSGSAVAFVLSVLTAIAFPPPEAA